MFTKSNKKKDIGVVLLGFATLMFGMETMTDAVSGLRDIPAFQEMFIMFKNPILGVIVGAVLTAIIQSSSASVGILPGPVRSYFLCDPRAPYLSVSGSALFLLP